MITWISIDDRLPPEYHMVIVYHRANQDSHYNWNQYTFLGYYADRVWYGGSSVNILTGVTHWAEFNSPSTD